MMKQLIEDIVKALVDLPEDVQIKEVIGDHAHVLELRVATVPFSTVTADIPYMNPSLTSSGWVLQLGAGETDGRDVSPVGFRFCDLIVTAEER